MVPASPRVYRVHLALQLALAAGGIFWAAMGAALWPSRALVSGTILGCLGFALFFALAWGLHARMRIVVDERSVSYRGPFKRLQVPFADILKVDMVRGLAITVYLVVTRHGPILFSSNFSAHRDLLRLLCARSGLPNPRG
jgi:hypothetical protein